MEQALFYTKSGLMFPGFSLEQVRMIRRSLVGEFGLTSAQLAEAAGYSLSMVLRYALGLSSSEAQLAMVVGDGLAGMVALASARQMQNAGARVRVVAERGALSAELQRAVSSAEKMGVGVFELARLEEATDAVHAVVLAAVDLLADNQAPLPGLIEYLNESSTPVHCVDVPPGVDLNSGAAVGERVYAASTVAVGVPLAALHGAREVAGRLYVCDVSVPKILYKIANTDLGQIFTEQPVQQIFAKVD